MPTINPTLPPDNRVTGGPDPAGDMDKVHDALVIIISAINTKVESVNGKTGLTVVLAAADILGLEIPNYYNYTTSTYPTRPTYSGVVLWIGPTQPSLGAGGMIDASPQYSKSDRWIVIP